MRKPLCWTVALLAGVAAPVGAAGRLVPTGAKIERSGYATILRAPSPDYRKLVRPVPRGPQSAAELYAQEQGIPLAAAEKQVAEQDAMFSEYNRLAALLQQQESDNYLGAELVHGPNWHYRLFFRRDPEATLHRYTSNPRFRAARGGPYTAEELKRIVDPWAKRLSKAGLATHWAVDATGGTAEFYVGVTEAEYRRIAQREGWGDPPTAIRMQFAKSIAGAPVDPRVSRFIRSFASDTRATGIQLEAGFSGKIVLRDGCLRVEDAKGQLGPLAYFHRETGLGIDPQGYLGLIDRRSGEFKGRIGEMFVWAGPNAFRENMPGLAELKARCGDGPVRHVGNPESKARMDVKYAR